MKKIKVILMGIFLMLFSSGINAQMNERLVAEGGISINSEFSEMEMTAPSFIGGQEALETYIAENLKYPELAIRQGLEGTVLILFKISSEGEIMDISIRKSCKPILDTAALNLIKEMPNWSPATYGNSAVETYFQLPIKFRLQ